MLNKETTVTEKKTITINATSTITDAESGVSTQICTMSTQFDKVNGKLVDYGMVSITKIITNNEAYRKNKEQYEKDCAEFEEYVNSMLADEEVANDN